MENTERKITALETTTSKLPTNLLCLSHLRWDFVFQRPQHLLTRFSKTFNVFFFEEPIFEDIDKPYLSISSRGERISIMVPHIPAGLAHEEVVEIQKDMLDRFLVTKNLADFAFWYYTPMALEFTDHHKPAVTIYDCMDELAAFKFAPPQLKQLELDLMDRADVVFTGGHSLFEAKRNAHSNIYPYPSSIDKKHFEKARYHNLEPEDQIYIKGPKIGFFGVIDERFNIDLIRRIAEARPQWQLVLIGPVVKIDPATLPRLENIHYLGSKSYQELPAYLSGWDIALIPFMLNESTRFISPTKTPEYLAAGIPVISTAIRDVVKPYGVQGLVSIGTDHRDFIKAIEAELNAPKEEWLAQVDEFLSTNSWDLTTKSMLNRIESTLSAKFAISAA